MTDGISKQGADAIAEAFTTAYESKMTMRTVLRSEANERYRKDWVIREYTTVLDFKNRHNTSYFEIEETNPRSTNIILAMDKVESITADDTALTVKAGIYTVQIAIVQEPEDEPTEGFVESGCPPATSNIP